MKEIFKAIDKCKTLEEVEELLKGFTEEERDILIFDWLHK